MLAATGPHHERHRGLAAGRELEEVVGPALRRQARTTPPARVARLVSAEQGTNKLDQGVPITFKSY